MLMVQVLDTASNVLELDGVDEEIEYLPNGIGLAGLIPNSTTTTDFRPTCLLLFDGVGRIETLDHYQIRPPGSVTTFLSTKYKINFNADVWQNLGYSPVAEASQAAFVLYDRTDFAQQTPNTTSTAGSRMSPEQLSWLDQNAVAIVMKRYNGTLIRGE